MPLNTLPFPSHEDVPYYDNKDKDGFLTMPVEQYKRNSAGSFVPVGDDSPLPIKDADVLAKLVEILSKLSSDPATQTTLADISAKLATVSKQDVIIGHVDGVETALANILAKIIAAPATEAKQDTLIGHVDGVEGTLTALNGKDFATQATLAAILNKIIAAPATEAKQTALNALVGEVQAAPTANTLLARLKNLETKVDAIIADGVQLSGSNMELYGATINDRPAANAVKAGATFTIVDATQEFKSWMSDGVSWGEEI